MHTIEQNAVTLTFLEGDIVHAHFKDGHTGPVADVHGMFERIAAERGGRKVLLMVSVGQGSSLTNDARALASSEVGDHIIAADAIIIRDFGHQLSANAFVRHNRPMRPIRLFPDQQSAMAWLTTQHHLIDAP